MASSLKRPFQNPTSASSSSSAGETETESEEEEEVEGHKRTIFSSDEDEPQDPPARSSGEAHVSGRKRVSEGIPTNLNSMEAKKTQPSFKRLFSEKDEVVLLQGIVGYKGNNNPLEDKRPLYESMKASFSFDVTLHQFKDKIGSLKRKYTRNEMRGGVASSVLNPHQQKCFQLSKVIWGVGGIAFNPADWKSKESERRASKKRDLVTSRKGKNNAQEEGSKRGGDMKKKKKKKSRLVVEKESADWDDESAFFLGVDFLREKWTKVPPTQTKKETQEKMKKLHASELECLKFEEMLKAMKDKCAHDKVELLNEVTSLIIAAD